MLLSAGRVERKLLALLAVAYLSLFVIVGAIWGSRAHLIDGQRVEVLHTSLYQLSETLSLLKDAETGQRGFLLTGEDSFLQPYNVAVQHLHSQFQALRAIPLMEMYADDIARIEQLAELKMTELSETIALRRLAGAEAARQRVMDNQGRRYMDELRERISSLEGSVSDELQTLHESTDVRSQVAIWGGSAVALLMLGLLGLTYLDLRRDLREREELLKRLAFESQHDALTQLPNRRAFNDSLDQALALARRAERPLALIYLDLDGFKPVNDEHGHATGDRVLKAIAQRWRTLLREGEVLARLGGDEFAVVAEGDVAAIECLAARMITALDTPLLEELPHVRVGVSIGMAQFPQHGEDRRRLVAAADTAMYRAKEAGKHCFAWPEPSSAIPAAAL